MKRWAIFNKQNQLLRYRKLRKDDVFAYFIRIKNGSRGLIGGYTKNDKRLYFIKKKGEYCERCGAGIGKRYMFKNIYLWKGFDICGSCYDDKLEGRPQLTPDLEDLM